MHVSPVVGATVEASPTVPLKPCNAVTVTVLRPDEPALALTLVGLAEIVKSCTVIVTVVE